MFDRDDLEPIKKSQKPRDLEGLSLVELGDYIIQLKQEIIRTEEMISRKTAHQHQASTLFKS